MVNSDLSIPRKFHWIWLGQNQLPSPYLWRERRESNNVSVGPNARVFRFTTRLFS
jgi:hypothetical protein